MIIRIIYKNFFQDVQVTPSSCDAVQHLEDTVSGLATEESTLQETLDVSDKLLSMVCVFGIYLSVILKMSCNPYDHKNNV
jgi:hypothetical protein